MKDTESPKGLNARGQIGCKHQSTKTVLVIAPTDTTVMAGGSIVRPMRIARAIASKFRTYLRGYKLHTPYIGPLRFLFLSPYWLCSLVVTLLSKRWDCLYFYIDRYGCIVAFLLRAMRLLDAKIVFHVLLTPSRASRVSRWFDRLACKLADMVVVESDRAARIFSRFASRIIKIPNFLDNKFTPQQPEVRACIRSKYSFSDCDRVVGIIGPFNNPYNEDHLRFLENEIERFDRRIKFLVIGQIDDNQKIRVGGDRVVYTGHVNDYVAHLSSVDCVVVPRTVATDGQINRILEAMSLGIPVVATPMAFSTLENVQRERGIFVCGVHDIPWRINEVIFDEKLMSKTGKNGRLAYERYYAHAKFQLIAALEKLY